MAAQQACVQPRQIEFILQIGFGRNQHCTVILQKAQDAVQGCNVVAQPVKALHHAPFATFGGQYLYPSVQAKAAQLGFGLVCNHPFVDGNKRIGAHVMLVFLAINGIELDYTQEELIDIILQIASGRAKAADLLEWILYHQA